MSGRRLEGGCRVSVLFVSRCFIRGMLGTYVDMECRRIPCMMSMASSCTARPSTRRPCPVQRAQAALAASSVEAGTPWSRLCDMFLPVCGITTCKCNSMATIIRNDALEMRRGYHSNNTKKLGKREKRQIQPRMRIISHNNKKRHHTQGRHVLWIY